MRRNAAQRGLPDHVRSGSPLLHDVVAVVVEELLDGIPRIASGNALELLPGELVALRLGEGDHLLGSRAALAPCIPAGTMDVPHLERRAHGQARHHPLHAHVA